MKLSASQIIRRGGLLCIIILLLGVGCRNQQDETPTDDSSAVTPSPSVALTDDSLTLTPTPMIIVEPPELNIDTAGSDIDERLRDELAMIIIQEIINDVQFKPNVQALVLYLSVENHEKFFDLSSDRSFTPLMAWHYNPATGLEEVENYSYTDNEESQDIFLLTIYEQQSETVYALVSLIDEFVESYCNWKLSKVAEAWHIVDKNAEEKGGCLFTDTFP